MYIPIFFHLLRRVHIKILLNIFLTAFYVRSFNSNIELDVQYIQSRKNYDAYIWL